MRFKKILWGLLGLFVSFSILFNFIAVVNLMDLPDYKTGVLLDDLEIADYRNDGKVLFKLPKGINVMNVSPRGFASWGLFDAERFSIVIVTSNAKVVDYNTDETIKFPNGALYRLSGKSVENAN
jgi:hypothetical protein